MIIKLAYFNDIRRVNELAFTYKYLILNLLLKEHFALLN